MNFKSQICTTREQSERLLSLGLKKETADMAWWSHTVDWCGIVNEDKRQWHLSIRYVEAIDARMETLPAWSLHRLIEIVAQTKYPYRVISKELPIYDALCERIEWLIKEGYFPKEYLV